jgi:2-oxoisovalerate dehydrogenase E1 component
VDGNDALAVQQAAAQAIGRARAGDGPTLLECETYRTRPHAEGMGDYSYRTREDVAAWRERCPIKRLHRDLIDKGIATDAELNAAVAEIQAQVAAAEKTAERAPLPEAASATEHVYCSTRALVPTAPPAGGREISSVAGTVEALDAAMARDGGIFVLGEGIGERGGNFATTTGLFKKYGAERLRDTPICERGFVGLACGSAMTGTRPVIDFMFADFINDAFGELVNQIAKIQYMSSGRLRMPVILRGCIGIGHSAATHHSGKYYSIYAHIPGLRVVVPSSPFDAKGLFAHALNVGDPVLFLEHRELMSVKGPVPVESYEIEFGKARIVRAGTDVTVVALALMVHRALAVAEELAKEGISVELIDPRTIAPLDVETVLESVAKTGRLLILDEDFAPFGFGAEIAAVIADRGFDDLDAPIRRLNGAFAPTPYSPPLEKALVPQSDEIARAIRDLAND